MSKQEASDFKLAYAQAIRFLAVREHSCKELVAKMSNKGFHIDVVQAVIDKLQLENLQNDERFAESFVRLWSSKGKGPIKIRLELEQHGLSSQQIDYAFSQEPIDWLQKVELVWQKKFNYQPKTQEEKAKQFRFLQNRGFSTSQIASVIKLN